MDKNQYRLKMIFIDFYWLITEIGENKINELDCSVKLVYRNQ